MEREDFLQLSGLQHFCFCKRQWALIHIEQQWAENLRTTEGELLHEKAHSKEIHETRGDLIITRGMYVFSNTLAVTGACDVVEFHRAEEGITLNGREGLWAVFPVEYKRGKPKEDLSDRLQLCGQAICLEEMLCCSIPEGALYYGELRHRHAVSFDEELRQTVRESLTEMQRLYQKGHTPKVKARKGCASCSLKELCLPKLLGRKSPSAYIKQHMEETP